jgi:hypothetical protein
MVTPLPPNGETNDQKPGSPTRLDGPVGSSVASPKSC